MSTTLKNAASVAERRSQDEDEQLHPDADDDRAPGQRVEERVRMVAPSVRGDVNFRGAEEDRPGMYVDFAILTDVS